MGIFDTYDSDSIYKEIERAGDGQKVKFEGKEWEDREGEIVSTVQKMFLDEIENIYTMTYESIERAFDDGLIDETFRDTLLEYVNNRNSKYWDSTDFF